MRWPTNVSNMFIIHYDFRYNPYGVHRRDNGKYGQRFKESERARVRECERENERERKREKNGVNEERKQTRECWEHESMRDSLIHQQMGCGSAVSVDRLS